MLPLGSRPLASCLLRATNIVAFELSASVGLETPLTMVVRVYVGSLGVGEAAVWDPPQDPSSSARRSNLSINHSKLRPWHHSVIRVPSPYLVRAVPNAYRRTPWQLSATFAATGVGSSRSTAAITRSSTSR